MAAAACEGFDLEAHIGDWRARVTRFTGLVSEEQSAQDGRLSDANASETRLRDQIAELTRAGLDVEEAFTIALKRLAEPTDARGSGQNQPDSASAKAARALAGEHFGRLADRLAAAQPAAPVSERATVVVAQPAAGRSLLTVVIFAVAAALAVKAPAALGFGDFEDHAWLYRRNWSLFVLAPLAGYFAWQRKSQSGRPVAPLRTPALLAVPLLFAAAAVLANVWPFTEEGQTEWLTAIHLPFGLWLVTGVVHAGGKWRSHLRRMEFVRFTGEWIIYYVLLALGGGVLLATTVGVFDAIGIEISGLVESWLLPCGAAGAVIVAAWLAEVRQGVVENTAPVLTRVFTPLFTVMLLAFLAAMAVTRSGIDAGRDLLIFFDVLLVVVVGLLLYAISARDPDAAPGLFDVLQVVLAACALVTDALAMAAIIERTAEFGFTANRTAALGLNVILLISLARTAWLDFGFVRRRRPFADVERWQTVYIGVYAVWAAVVVAAFPLLFDFA